MIRLEMTAATRRWMMAGLGLAALPACTFDADNPAAITEPGLDDQRAVVALVQGVVGDYDFAFQRSSLYSGLISDEVRSSGSYASWRAADVDGVVDANSPTAGVQNVAAEWWVRLHRARVLAEVAYNRVDGSLAGQQRASLLALSRAYSGMSYRDIGEYFCSAAYDAGPEVARQQSLERARTHLTESIALAGEAGVDSIATLARFIRGQVNYSLGDLDAALADVRAVPKGFRWNAHYRDGAYEANENFAYMNEQGLATVETGFTATGDPRVVVKANGKGADKVTARFDQQKFTAHSNIGLAKWQEARLVEAEILLSRGELASAIALINEVRVAAGVAPVATTLTAAQAETALRNERRLELFMEGQRMLDMRRWNLFPQGWQASCVPIPASEIATNPNI